MKTIYRFIILFATLLIWTGCVREEIVEDFSVEIMARMESEVDTRTSLSDLQNGMYYPLWAADDEIAVYVDNDTDPSKFTLTSGEETTVASFTGSRKGDDYIAVYPYDVAGSISDGAISLTLPSTQKYVKDSFGPGAFPMLATGSANDGLTFMNLCSVLKISLTGTAAVRNVKLTANDENTFMSGPASVAADYTSASESLLSMSAGGSRSVVLETKGLEISEDSPADVFIVVPSQTYKGGFTIEVDTYTETVTKKVSSDITFERSQIRHLKGFTVHVEQETDPMKRRLVKEKQALIAFYNALDGDNWYDIWNGTNNQAFEMLRWNLHFDEPVSCWYGVTTNEDGLVTELRLPGLNLKGSIPDELFELTELTVLQLNSNSLSGSIPHEIKHLTKLKELCLDCNRLSGEIPKELGSLLEIETLWLGGNALTGSFPKDLINLNKIDRIQFNDNLLSGQIPDEFRDWYVWNIHWGMMVIGNRFRFQDLYLTGPEFDVVCMNGKKINSENLYKDSKYTILLQWHAYDKETATPETMIIINHLKDIYESSADDIEIVSWANSNIMTEAVAEEFIEYNDIQWDNFYFDYENNVNTIGTIPWYPSHYTTSVTVVDREGKIVFTDLFADKSKLYDYERNYLAEWIGDDFDIIDETLYYSSDYSSDGTVKTLQTATVGNGIDIVLMGDAYSDREIADGSYEADMEYMYDNLFTQEPFTTHKDMFNVYYVNVVSATEGYDYAGAALGGYFGDGTLVGGNDNKCFEYALNAVSEDRMDEALIIVAMNSDAYAGTCYMYYPESATGPYSSGPAVAYFPKGTDQATFAQLLHHEANGHGFAKLADEYAYEDYGAVPEANVTQTCEQQSQWGWWKNVDFTNDPAQVRWSYFLEDARYANEGLGVFEGGLTYWTGVWRPTENSIMRYNTGGFNAPSREAIYYRIHKLAYGDSWEYSYEDFVEYDAVNRSTSASAPQKARRNYVEKPLEPTAAPVVVGKSWRDAR